MKTRRSRGRETKVQRETIKEEDTSPSSTTQIDNTTIPPTILVIAPDDEKIISSSTLSCDDGSPSPPLDSIKQKQALNSPPDDVRAFFGHPLTRATNAFNGEAADTNASAEALLHEYIHLSVIERDDTKSNEKPPRYIDAISSNASDPQLPTSRTVTGSRAAHTDSSGSGKTSHDELDHYGKESSGDSSQTSESVYIREYEDMFMSDEFPMDLNDGQADGRVEAGERAQSRSRVSSRARSKKGVHGAGLGKRTPPNNGQKTARKPRSNSNVVSSTTNSMSSKPEDNGNKEKEISASKEFPKNAHQFQEEGLPIMSEDSKTTHHDSIASSTESGNGINATSNINSGLSDAGNSHSSPTIQQLSPQNLPKATEESHTTQQMLTVVETLHQNNTISISLPNHVISSIDSPPPPSSISPLATASSTPNIPQDSKEDLPPPLKEINLKKVLSDKIRSRQNTEDPIFPIPASNNVQFIPEGTCGISIESKFPSSMGSIKQEAPYSNLYHPDYIYGSDPPGSMVSLTNYSALALPSYPNIPDNVVSVTMATCSDIMASNDVDRNGCLNVITPSSLHGDSIDNSALHHLHNLSPLQQHHHNHLNNVTNNHNMEDPMIVQSAQGQYFQVLQPLQPFDSHSQVTSTNHATTTHPATAGTFYSPNYQRVSNPHLLGVEKQVTVEHYLHQQHQYAYGGGYNFLNPDINYSMKSPDSYQEPCLSPNSSALVLKEMTATADIEVRKRKAKKRKLVGQAGDPEGEEDTEELIKYSPTSRSDKSHPRSPNIPKLDDNLLGYSYFLETPISTTRHRDEDRVTYVNKSQYYGLTLEFNGQDRGARYAGVKSVIILAFREEKPMEEEKKAWEYWHGRQHSYKQRILDIDTKNCHGVSPQNIEEVAFNAVAVKWNAAEGPVRVNIAVHCLSTDFSNQKGVKGIPLHIQIDTYEQGPKDIFLVHRGYCQIKAFCDKGAERKTRDEERRKSGKGKSEEYGGTTGVSKGRRKLEEAFHDPCDRSEFYSMANIATPPVFFNPLHENTEFVHKSLSLGVVPSQDEEVSSLPNSLQLPDSCDDYYTNSPARRPHRDSYSAPMDHHKAVLLYVREHVETVYTALMLEVPTLNGLLRSIEQKYSIPPFRVKNLYKKSRKGILVKLDDNIVRHYSHEATFIIEINLLNNSGDYEIILIELGDVTT